MGYFAENIPARRQQAEMIFSPSPLPCPHEEIKLHQYARLYSPFHSQSLKRLLGARNEFLATLSITLPLAGKKEETIGFLGACILDHVIER